jgi:type VI protein secretion system component Hcp
MKYSGGINGSYKSTGSKVGVAADTRHDNWSEIHSLKYKLAEDSSSVTITKPADKASAMLYHHYLQCRFKDTVAGSQIKRNINQIDMELCRWVDIDNDGVVDKFVPFIKYRFVGCRILDYEITRGDSNEDLPEETITIGFKEMHMTHYTPNDPSSFGWDFRENKTVR